MKAGTSRLGEHDVVLIKFSEVVRSSYEDRPDVIIHDLFMWIRVMHIVFYPGAVVYAFAPDPGPDFRPSESYIKRLETPISGIYGPAYRGRHILAAGTFWD